MPLRPRLVTLAALALAAAAFAPFAASAALFARLPPPPVALADLGWPRDAGGRAPGFVHVDADGHEAWVALEGRVCRVSLATGRARGCAALPGDATQPIQHARGAGKLLVVLGDAGEPLHLTLALFDDAAPDAAPALLDWSDARPRLASLANVAWNDARHAFELLVDTHDPQRGVVVVGVRPGGDGAPPTLLDEEPFGIRPWALPPALEHARWVAAFDGAPPSGVLADDDEETHAVRDGAAERLGVPAARVAVASRATFAAPPPFAVWIDGQGAVARVDEARWPIDVVVRGDAPVAVAHARGDRAAALVVPFAGRTVTFAASARGGERVLFARGEGQGTWRRVARDAGNADAWTAIPGDDALLLLDVRAARAVVLGRDLARAGEVPPLAARAARLVAERVALSPLGTASWLAALVFALPLFAIALASLARSAPPSRRVPLALAVYALAAGATALLEHAAMFPP